MSTLYVTQHDLLWLIMSATPWRQRDSIYAVQRKVITRLLGNQCHNPMLLLRDDNELFLID